mmetsp:Transcript_38222/g.75240  ORF Transcript_38222/g.75240 Transcript_38222/m.75240 type:complete len:301 (+) Transcript_38222:43-945(+)
MSEGVPLLKRTPRASSDTFGHRSDSSGPRKFRGGSGDIGLVQNLGYQAEDLLSFVASDAGLEAATDWLSLLKQSENMLHTILEDIRFLAKSTRAHATRQRKSIQSRLQHVSLISQKLKQVLTAMMANPTKFQLGDGEIRRREKLMKNLDTLHTKVVDVFSKEAEAAKKSRLQRFLASASSQKSASSYQSYGGLDNSQILDHQRAHMLEQEDRIDEIMRGVDHLRSVSRDIHGELQTHSNLIDDIGVSIDGSDAFMKASEQDVEALIFKKRNKSCCPLMTIVCLAVVILLLLFTHGWCFWK